MTLQEKNEIVRALLRNLDGHSEGERAHAERVAVYAVATGDALGIDGEDLNVLRYAAQLHDVGKVQIDKNLLNKIGQLSIEEINALRLHAEFALEVIKSYDFLAETARIIRHHHERWDGQGYPEGLKGDAIPLGARIIAVAETFDTLTLPPVWCKGLPEISALEEIQDKAGVQFDPEVVDAFLQVQPIIQPVGL